MNKITTRLSATVLAASLGVTGAAYAEPLNIWSASQGVPQLENVRHGGKHYRRHHHRHGINPGLAAIGVIGGIAAGAAIAGSRDRYYYDDDYYYDEGPAYYYENRDYCADNGGKPSHYPAPPGC